MNNRRILLSAAYLLLLLSTACQSGGKKTDNDPSGTELAHAADTFRFDTLRGIYFGDFGGHEIRIAINFVSENHAVGYNILKGLQRNIAGKVTMKAETIEMELAEPGDDKNDGVFSLSVNRQTLEMNGSWKPNIPGRKTKTFRLQKMEEPDLEYGVLNAADFANAFSFVMDSIGELRFHEDGLCVYSWYPDKDDEMHREQLEEIEGSWAFSKNKVTVDWKANSVFPSKSVFTFFYPKASETEVWESEDLPYVETEGRIFNAVMW